MFESERLPAPTHPPFSHRGATPPTQGVGLRLTTHQLWPTLVSVARLGGGEEDMAFLGRLNSAAEAGRALG